MRTLIVATLFVSASICFCAQESKQLVDFEKEEDLKFFYHNDWDEKAQLDTKVPLTSEKHWSEQHASSGKKSLKITQEYLRTESGDWSGYESLDLEVFVDSDNPASLSICVADQIWLDSGKLYWNRHNSNYPLKPGANTVSIPVSGLFRGEAGSRGHADKTAIDTSKIRRFDLGFNAKQPFKAVYIDNLRLVKETPPEGVQAFDFGPEAQNVFPGFTAISWNTVHGKNGKQAGFSKAGNGSSRARDDTFPTRLYQDFVCFEEDSEFLVDLPNGIYHGWIMFDDCGYWGGEQAQHRIRKVFAENKQVGQQERPHGPHEWLFRFEDVEPRPGESLWELYMQHIFQPVRFSIEVTDGTLNLRTTADNKGWNTKVAAVIVYPEGQKAAGEKYVAQIEARNRAEFESRAAFQGPLPKKLEIPQTAIDSGYWLGIPTLEQTITFEDAPGVSGKPLQRYAARGQRVSYTFAIRPLRQYDGAVQLIASDLTGPEGSIKSAEVDLRFVHHGTVRGQGITYSIEPHGIRKVAGANLQLRPNLTRQFWITLAVPADAKPGLYRGQLTLTAGELKLTLPLSVEVCDIVLQEPPFAFGFYGQWAPGGQPEPRGSNVTRELLTLLKQNGMNSFTGGPSIKFEGLDANGKPRLDFTACDKFFTLVKECGFTGELQSYGGPGMVTGLHDGYVIGKTGKNWEQTTGKPFKELVTLVWTAVREHAQQAGWPPIAHNFCDEPRVLEPALELLELMKVYREAAPWVKIGGAYSVHWGDKPLDKAIQEIFKTLVWSGLNLHTETDLQKAKEFGRELYIYNQGRSRFSFGMYQWAEMQKGVKGRQQWHTLCLHGYQFFDLDGREPDTAAINWGRNEIIPTIALPRCREGADDLRFAWTLHTLAQNKKDAPESKAALAFLETINQQIKIGQRLAPKELIDDETFRNTCIEHIKKLQGLK